MLSELEERMVDRVLRDLIWLRRNCKCQVRPWAQLEQRVEFLPCLEVFLSQRAQLLHAVAVCGFRLHGDVSRHVGACECNLQSFIGALLMGHELLDLSLETLEVDVINVERIGVVHGPFCRFLLRGAVDERGHFIAEPDHECRDESHRAGTVGTEAEGWVRQQPIRVFPGGSDI